MGFSEAIRQCFVKYATFAGRARRAEFWWFYLFVALVGIVTSVLDSLLWTPRFDPQTSMSVTPQYISTVVGLALLLPSLAAASRRLHDINRSGWWQFVTYGAAVLAFVLMALIGLSSGEANIWVVLPLILPLIAGLVLLVWYCTKGTVGANRFGPDPLL